MQNLPELSFKINEDYIFQVNKLSKFNLFIQNNGFKPSPRISIIITSPKQIIISPEKRQIGSLGPGKSREISYRIRPKANGDFVLTTTILIASNKFVSNTFSIVLHIGSDQKNIELKEIRQKEVYDNISPETTEKKESNSRGKKTILNLTCPLCGVKYGKDSIYCSSCGYNLKSKQEKEQDDLNKRCPICGSLVPINSLFCRSCGTKFE